MGITLCSYNLTWPTSINYRALLFELCSCALDDSYSCVVLYRVAQKSKPLSRIIIKSY